MRALYALARPVLFGMDAETAHGLTIRGLAALPRRPAPAADPRLAVHAFGLDFPNPVGLAAGFDKGAEVPDAILAQGFGFTEIGTVTPRPQPGNPRPRLFRLVEDEAVVNRFGFNSEGHAVVARRLAARAGRPGIVGVNIGANKDATDRVADYVEGVRAFARYASYLTVNISSPNTPGLRDLQQASVLDDLLARVLDARDGETTRLGRRVPVLLKIAPDLALGDLDDIVRVARVRAVDGMIVSNTTVERPASLRSAGKVETGGLSGAPLFELSTRMLAETYRRVERQFPLVGVGGIDGPPRAFQKIAAGASLLQLYSMLVFRGPGLARDIVAGLPGELARAGLGRLEDAVGSGVSNWMKG